VRRVILGFVAVLLAAVSLLVVGAPDALAADCGPNRLVTDATVNPDTSMDVVEHLTFDFPDGCHGGLRFLEPGDYTVGPITVTEHGETVPIAEEHPLFVKWGEADVTVSGLHTYDISYHVDRAVKVAPDVAELNWQFVGTDFPFMKRVDVTITTPGDPSANQIFVHGALNGVSSLDGPRVVLGVDDNPASTFIEAHVLMSPANFTVAPSGAARLDAIKAEELEDAKQADVRRQQLRDELDRKKKLKLAGTIASPVVAAAGLLGFALVFVKWGKEPPKPADVGEYWRDIPPEPPAVARAVLDFGSVGNDAFSTTLVDLAQRGWLTITQEGDDYRFTRTAKAQGDLNDYETKILWRLFPHGGSVTQDEIVSQAKADRSESTAWINDFKGGVRRDFAARGFIDDTHSVKWFLHGGIVLLVAGFGAVFALGFEAPLGWVTIGVALVLLLLSPLMRKRTPAGAHKAAEVAGLKKFLQDFSRLGDEAHVGDLVLYERYLVYAVALGVAKELVDGLRVRFPELAQPNSGFAPWYIVGAYGSPSFDRLSSVGNIGSFAHEFTSATAAAFSPPSSTGGGGGFSGGGGGGGGGGGAGGW
jgi:uncharacterized membrane protein